MSMLKYVFKRIGLMFMTFMIIMTICFVLIKLLQPEMPMMGLQAETEMARREALGWNKPIMEQYGIYLRNIVTKWDWGTSWKIGYMEGVGSVLFARLPPTVLMNVYSMILSIPIGIALGIVAAIFKNRLVDHVISTIVMLFVSVPSFVYAFLVQFLIGFRLSLLPVMVSSLFDAGGSWLTWPMFRSMILPVLSLAFGTIAGLARFTRAELTEALTSEYMLLARAKGLTKNMAIARHALRNAMVPILPMILGEFLHILSGSMIIESIFVVNGVGKLYLQSIQMRDYDVFVATSMFYTIIGLSSIIVIDLSYGFIDPRIRMGEK